MALLRPRALAPAPEASPPVPYTSRRTITTLNLGANPRDTVRQLQMMGQVPTLFGIVHRTTTSTAAVDWKLWRKAKSGNAEDRTEVTAHAALDLVNQPNPFFHRQELTELVQQHVDLCGRGFLILYLVGKLPIEMWWARPDRMMPVPHPTKYLAGWVYTAPDGDRIPLSVDEVIPMRMPDPMDPYGGLAPTMALLPDMDATRLASEWNRNFFLNSAEPGGIVEFPETLDDDEFQEFKARWQESHQGVARAHRVAMLEGGAHWVDRNVSQKDMQFVELQTNSRDRILEGYTIHKGQLGITEDINRANQLAGAEDFTDRLIEPRLERWKAAYNGRLLPMYGATARDLEFDYECVESEDAEGERADMVARAQAAQAYAAAGYPRKAIAVALELPTALQEADEPEPPPAPVIVPPPAAPADEEEAPPAPVAARAERLRLTLPRAESDIPELDQVDHTETQAAWERLVEQLTAEWATITAAQRAELLAQITAAVDAGDLPALTELSVSTAEAEELLAGYLDRMATEAAHKVVREGMSQGAELEPHTPKRSEMADLAAVTTALIGSSLALSAGREAMRVQSAGMSGTQVADLVGQYLSTLTAPKAELGGALTGAQNQARIETMRRGPEAALYADERMDANTCKNCREINGRWIGNTSDGVAMAEVERLYPQGGYVDCLGRSRCRGTITGLWRSKQVEKTGGD